MSWVLKWATPGLCFTFADIYENFWWLDLISSWSTPSTNCASATASIRVFFHRTQLLYLICPPANGRGSLHSDETLKRKNAQTLQVQCDQIGWFLNVLNNRFSYRSNPNIYEFLGSLCKQPLLSKMCFGWLLSNFWKNWLLFIPTHGHTGIATYFLLDHQNRKKRNSNCNL